MTELSSDNAILIMPLQKHSTRKSFMEIKKEKMEEFSKTGKIGALKIRDRKMALKLIIAYAKENANASHEREVTKSN